VPGFPINILTSFAAVAYIRPLASATYLVKVRTVLHLELVACLVATGGWCTDSFLDAGRFLFVFVD
jgi:hypothetical protein